MIGILKEASDKLNGSVYYNILVSATKDLQTKPWVSKNNKKKIRSQLLLCLKDSPKMDIELAVVCNILLTPLMTLKELLPSKYFDCQCQTLNF